MKLTHIKSRWIYRTLKFASYLPGFYHLLDRKVQHDITKLDASQTPLSIILYVTNRCNARCVHCFYWRELSNTLSKLSLSEIKKLTENLSNSINTVAITGGEPFLRNDLVDICTYFYAHGKPNKLVLNTNGSFPTKMRKFLDTFISLGLTMDMDIHVSVDGPETLHNSIRNVDIYETAMQTINVVIDKTKQESHLHLCILTTVTDINISSLTSFIDEMFCKFQIYPTLAPARSPDTDIYGLAPDILETTTPKDDSGRLSDENYKYLIKFLKERHKMNGTILSAYEKVAVEIMANVRHGIHPGFLCRAGYSDCVIYPNGEVAMCEFSKPFANLRDYDMNLQALWNDEPAYKRREQLERCFCTHSCHLMNAMKYSTRTLMKVLQS